MWILHLDQEQIELYKKIHEYSNDKRIFVFPPIQLKKKKSEKH